MISIIKWILFTIFIFSTFATDSEMENSSESRAIISTLNFFAEMGDEENVKLMLNILCNKKGGKLIQFLMTGDGKNMTALLYAAANGHVKIVKLFLDVFSEEKDELIQFLMKENEHNITALLLATNNGHVEIVKLLLDVFSEGKKGKLIAYLMKEYHPHNVTVVIVAAHNGYEGIIKLFLDVFSEEKKRKID